MTATMNSVLVVGLGESGFAMAKHVHQGATKVTVLDSRANPINLAALRAGFETINFVSEALDSEQALGLIAEHDLIAWSPGLSPVHGASAVLYQAALAQGKTPMGELDFFGAALEDLAQSRGYRPKRIAITGTNGKTTTTMLTAHLLLQLGVDAVVAGNVSPSLLDVLRERIASGVLPQAWVLELSSFQLATSQAIAFDAATVLNVSQDHLDWHRDMDDYVAAKQRIFDKSAVCVFNRHDSQSAPVKAQLAINDYIDLRQRKPKLGAQQELPSRVVSFGTDEPRSDLDFGLVQGGGVTWLSECLSSDDEVWYPGLAQEVRVNRLMPADAMLIRGSHNHANALAALALIKACGLRIGPVLHALGRYPGEPHRCELVNVINDVEYIEDSKGTNVGATMAALQGLGNAALGGSTKRIVLIAGGDGKGQDFTPLGGAILSHAKALLTIGQDGAAIEQTARNAALDLGVAQDALPIIESCASLEQAVQRAANLATTGDVVLLSPACASFDMFDNYKHRAEVFVSAVKQLAQAEGQIA